jgi:hypothetical protein
VLDVAGGLGATGRWLAGQLGHGVVTTAVPRRPPPAALTRRVTTRSGGARARRSGALPFRDARFTPRLAVETLPRRDAHAVLAELFRVTAPAVT